MKEGKDGLYDFLYLIWFILGLGKITTMAMSFASVVLTIFIWYLIKIEFMLPRSIDDKDNKDDDESIDIRREQHHEES